MVSRTQAITLATFFGIVALLPLVVRPFQMTTLTSTGLYALLALSMCVIVSYTGQFALLQTLSASVAGFLLAITVTKFGVPFGLGAVIGFAAAIALALFVSTFIFRLRGFYLGIGTMLITLVVPLVQANQLREWTGGYFGLSVPSGGFTIWGLNWEDRYTSFYAMWIGVAAVALFLANLERTRVVRAARAVKANQAAAQLAAIDPRRTKVGMLLLSAAVAASAGLLGTSALRYIDAFTYDISLTILIFAATIIGGRGSFWGAIVGALFITATNMLFQLIGERGTAVFGLLLIGILLGKPEGIIGFVPVLQRVWSRGSPELARVAVAPRTAERSAKAAAVTPVPILELKDLTVRFGGFTAVENVTMTVNAGSIVALLGPNGAGKTTIFNAVTGYNRPSAGTITFDGVPITARNTFEIRRVGVSRTLQIPHVFGELTTWENIAIGMDFLYPHGIISSGLALPSARRNERAIRDAALALCARVGLREMAFRKANQLSFGQSRLIDVARAMAGSCRLLLLDEPFAGLAPSMIGTVKELMLDLQEQGYTIVLIDHNFEHVSSICSSGHLLVGGKLERSGEIKALLNDDLVIQLYVGV